ncbi:MAG: hypothetical protein ACXADB_00485 [Candidatus Hermodarchaeia archaeon]|jgi:hypothetical protein
MIILEGFGRGKLLITEGFGPSGVGAYAPIIIAVETQELSQLVSAIPGSLDPSVVAAYLDEVSVIIDVAKVGEPATVSAVSIDPADIIASFQHPVVSIEKVLNVTSPELWRILTDGSPVVVYSKSLYTPLMVRSQGITPTFIAKAGDQLVPSIEGAHNE